jgi:Pentapeptide repeats (8 copies)
MSNLEHATRLAERVKAVFEVESDRLDDLVRVAKLNPASDLRYGDWRDLDLTGADLRGFDFTGADLTGARFDDALVAGAIFDDAKYDPAALARAADFDATDQKSDLIDNLASPSPEIAQSASIPLTMPTDYNQKAAAMADWLCGVHIVYRYSLDRISTDEVAREVIHIWNDGAFLRFRMSFINQSGGPLFYFEGPILLVGRSIILFGTNIGSRTTDREYDRARVIMIDHDNAGVDTRDCKIGLMTSTRPRRDHAPCTASTILIRTQWTAESHFEELARTATDIRPLDATINSDFGTVNSPLIKLFLDNRPHGCQLEPEMQQYAPPFVGQVPERTLRLDTERFASTMYGILPNIISNREICAPFKKNWVSRMHNAKK